MGQELESVSVSGFKTIRELRDFSPGPLTVLIGPNGAGKSNFISFFRLLSWAMAGSLQEHVAREGGASTLLHDGPERTRDIEVHLRMALGGERAEYYFRMAYAAGDALIFTEEKYRSPVNAPLNADWTLLGAGHHEAALPEKVVRGEAPVTILSPFLRHAGSPLAIPYHFHNTSSTARIRQKWSAADGRFLKEDAANLAPFLLRLLRHEHEYYRRILETVRLVLPFFADFELRAEYEAVLLRWREKGSDQVFHVGQAADGMLRILALIALLQQPPSDLPPVLILDEPELGLHPFAVQVIADLIRGVSNNTQVILATQSVSLIDHFEADEVVVVDRERRESKFSRLNPNELRSWLEAYSVSELWEKNVIGGRPKG